MNFSEYFKNNYNITLDDTKINDAVLGINYCIKNKIPIIIIGNGGSAYTGSHFAQDLSKIFDAYAYSLADNFGTIMAIANDISYDYTFSIQLPKFGKKILLVCISHSGNSTNVVFAAKRCYALDIPVLSFTGSNGGWLSKFSSLEINVPLGNIYTVESIHSMLCHFIIDEIKRINK